MQNKSLIDAVLSVPDWQDAGGYSSLRNLDRTGWAWQQLRRNTDFRAALKSSTFLTCVDRVVMQPHSDTPDCLWGVMFCRRDG